MSGKWTPGPWEIYCNSVVSGLVWLPHGKVQGDWIADIDHENQEDYDGEESETAHANARLIAQAPRIVEALARLVAASAKVSVGYTAELLDALDEAHTVLSEAGWEG